MWGLFGATLGVVTVGFWLITTERTGATAQVIGMTLFMALMIMVIGYAAHVTL